MATNFAEAFLSARNNAQDRTRQREEDAMQRQQFDLQMQSAQQKQQGTQQQALYGLAKGYKDYLASNPQGGAQYYENFLRPSLAGLGLGDSGPYNESEAISLADQVLAAYSGGKATNPYEGLPSDIQSLQLLRDNPELATLDRERRQAAGMVPKSIQTSQGYGWGTPGGAIELAPITGVAGQGAHPNQEAVLAQANQMIRQGAPEAQVEAWIGEQLSQPVTQQPQQIAQPYRAPQAPSEVDRRVQTARELGASDEDVRRMVLGRDAAAAGSKPLPAAVLKMREEAISEAETAKTINQSLDRHLARIDSGELNFSTLGNLANRGLNFAGMSSPESRNFAEFQNDLEKLRNDSLRLNAGVQTDGDAQRAWNELFSNLNDEQYVKQRLQTIRRLNERAETLKRASVDRIDQEYGRSTAPAQGGDDIDSLLDMYR